MPGEATTAENTMGVQSEKRKNTFQLFLRNYVNVFENNSGCTLKTFSSSSENTKKGKIKFENFSTEKTNTCGGDDKLYTKPLNHKSDGKTMMARGLAAITQKFEA
jgi:hypothetical protein